MRQNPPNYYKYIRSIAWRKKRSAYIKAKKPKGCAVCHHPRFELHHKTYLKLGSEPFNHLVPLCKLHHDELHKYHDKIGGSLWKASNLYLKKAKLRQKTLR